MTVPEENNYPKAIAYSTALMILLIVISYLIILGGSEQPTGTGGLVVNYGTSPEGMGTDYMNIDEPSVDPNANNTPPDKVVPNTEPIKTATTEKSNEKIVTQDDEDAPTVASKDNKSTTVSTAPPAKETKPVVNQNALYKGTKNKGTGAGDGTTATPGNQGSVNGNNLSTNYGEGGSGFGNLALPNRQFATRPMILDDGQISGKVVLQIRVDKNGVVVYARAGAPGTTTTNAALWRKCEQAMMGAKFNSSDSAPDVQSGTFTFNFKLD
jgi:hypothetical protein